MRHSTNLKRFKPLDVKKKSTKQPENSEIEYIDSPVSYGSESYEKYSKEIPNKTYSIESNIDTDSLISIDSTVKMSNNPFDILKDAPYKKQEHREMVKVSESPTATDDFILSCLKKPKTQQAEYKIIRKTGIFKKITILSKNEIILPSKKYFKFPFDMNIVNDESAIFSLIKEEFVNALASAYSNYRKFGESFKVLLNDDLVIFSDELRCSSSLSRLLSSNGIQFETDGDMVRIERDDIGLVYDVIINIDIPKGKCIPFILSEFEFENGIVFRTKVKKGPIVRSSNMIEYSYTLFGPLYSSDYHFDDDVFLDYIK